MSKESEVSWAAEEFAEVDLGDKRLNSRLITLCDRFSDSPESPIKQACADWAETKAAYRFLRNESVEADEILAAHRSKTAHRVKFIGYLGENESGADEYLVAWAEGATAIIIYSTTTNFVTFTRDPRGYANWGGNAGGIASAWREGDRLYLFGGKFVHEMVLPLQDQDGDGMNDDWEMQHFGSTTNSSGGANEDWDHDGFRDLYEYIAGTDPTNAGSLLIISDAWIQSTSNLVIKWPSVTNKLYSILQSPDLTGPWSLSASNLVGTAPLNAHTVDVDSAQEFVRIGVEK